MALVEAGVSGPRLVRRGRRRDPIGAWRALAARGLTGSGRWQRTPGPDGRPRSRRPPRGDARRHPRRGRGRRVELLLEAARVDPYPLAARPGRARAAGVLGGERVVLALKDLWAQADEPLRMAIADAWAMPRSADAGGRRELGWAADAARGSAQIAAAFGLVRAGGPESSQGVAVLEQTITTGTAKDRIFAILVSPIKEESIKAALKKASDWTPNEVVAAAALARRLESGPAPAGRERDLRQAAEARRSATSRGADLPPRPRSLAPGGAAVMPIVARDAHAQDPRLREAGGIGLALLRDYPHAAVVAVDQDRDVRTHASPAPCCSPRTDNKVLQRLARSCVALSRRISSRPKIHGRRRAMLRASSMPRWAVPSNVSPT